MNYLLTGATGFIGSKIVDLLLSQGHSVNYLGRKRSQHLDSRAAFHHWNTGELPPLDSVPRLDAVVHLAGEPVAQHWTPEAKRRIYNSRPTLSAGTEWTSSTDTVFDGTYRHLHRAAKDKARHD